MPLAPTLATTRLGTVCAGPKFRFEDPGLVSPVGHTVRNPPTEGPVTVTLSTTDVTPVKGTSPVPATIRSTCWPGPTGVRAAPMPTRVSSRRRGVTATSWPGVVAPAGGEGTAAPGAARNRSNLEKFFPRIWLSSAPSQDCRMVPNSDPNSTVGTWLPRLSSWVSDGARPCTPPFTWGPMTNSSPAVPWSVPPLSLASTRRPNSE